MTYWMIGPICSASSACHAPGGGGMYGSRVPALIGGSMVSDFKKAAAAAAIG
jgi:hypothetical protein